MLPVARNRSFHVPHGLAALAAAVCLVIAFTTEDGNSTPRLAGLNPEPCVQETIELEAHQDRPSEERQVQQGERQTVRRSASAVFIPWFPGRRSAGG
jgi:hypothetical protein